MLPFLKNQKEASVGSVSEPIKRQSDGEEEDLLETIMKELFESKTGKARAQAFRAAFEFLEQEPHEENNG